MHTGFWWGNLSKRDHMEDPGIDERMILKWTLRKWDEGMDWTGLAQDRDRWHALANTVISDSIKCREFLD